MKLIFTLNTLTACFIFESSTTHQFKESIERHSSVSYTDGENSLTDSEAHDSSQEKLHRHPHKHTHRRRSHNKYTSSNSKCHCDDCGSEGNEGCEEFCEKQCQSYYDSYQINPVTPEIIAVPYPVPVMIVTANNLNQNSTLSPTEKKETITTLKNTVTDEEPSKSSVSDKTTMTETTPMKTDVNPTPSKKGRPNLYILTYNSTYVITGMRRPVTLKKRKIIPFNKNMFFPFTTTPNHKFSTYRIIVPRKEVKVINLMRQFN